MRKIFPKGGFTLIESLIIVFIFALVMGTLSGLIVWAYKTHSYTWEQSLAIDEARIGVEMMSKQIRDARDGEDGSYPLEKADDKEIIFYSDIDGDNKTERMRYFLGTVNSGTLTQECQTSVGGGTCSVTFSNFLTGNLKSAQVKISVDGDLDSSSEYVTIYVDGNNFGNLCVTGCLHCAGAWQGASTSDVTSRAADNSIQFLADASWNVGKECPTGSPNHSMKARFELNWTEEIIGAGNELKKGIIKATGSPAIYLSSQEQVSVVTPYVRNDPPIFKYFDANGAEITSAPVRLVDTKLIKVFLVVNIDPNRPPNEFELETSVQLRNLKIE